jgi:hypothetical protein
MIIVIKSHKMNQKEQELLLKLREIIKEKEIPEPGADISMKEYILESVLPVLEATKDIQAPLYDSVFTEKKGLVGKVKNLLLGKMANITRNVVENSFIRQQKFNNSILQLFKYLVEENIELEKKLDGKK